MIGMSYVVCRTYDVLCRVSYMRCGICGMWPCYVLIRTWYVLLLLVMPCLEHGMSCVVRAPVSGRYIDVDVDVERGGRMYMCWCSCG